MASSILLLLLPLAMLHTAVAIKCIEQPNPEEVQKWLNENRGRGKRPDKQSFLQISKTAANVDCVDEARKKDQIEPTFCLSLDWSTCAEVPDFLDVNMRREDFVGIFLKQCLYAGQKPHGPNDGAPNVYSPESACIRHGEKFGGCTRCYTCNESDYCNAGAEKIQQWTNIPAPSATGRDGPASALFLLLLAIVSGALGWAGFR